MGTIPTGSGEIVDGVDNPDTITVPGVINMHGTDATLLANILEAAEAQYKAMAKLKHATEAEQEMFILRAAVCQSAYLQLEGLLPPATPGAVDWAVDVAKGIPYRVKGGTTTIDT